MKNKAYRNYYWFSLLGVALASFYPIYMGASVVIDLIRIGAIYAENYPKYLIPYTPISIALLFGVALMPLLQGKLKKYALALGTALSSAVFLGAELLFENILVVTKNYDYTSLEDWQMYLCVSTPPSQFTEETWSAIEVLVGDYTPLFKLHFYIISFVIILSLLNCFYGFAAEIRNQSKKRLRALTLQSVASVAFLAMCIFACFTAFYRTGTIRIAPVSAVLMAIFFILFGITAGVYVFSFTEGKRRLFSLALPCLTSALVTVVMYLGEMILLDGRLYRFGSGFFFNALGGLVLAPVDLLIILASGAITAGILSAIARWDKRKKAQ